MKKYPRFARIGVMTAMPQEFAHIQKRALGSSVEVVGPREFLSTELNGTAVVLTMSHIGQVAAATTATLLLHRFGVEAIVFTGVAGGIGGNTSIGDIVIADNLVQHDFDLKGVLGFERFVIPSLGVARMSTRGDMAELAYQAALAVVTDLDYVNSVQRLAKRTPKVHVGLVASGDCFVGNKADQQRLVDAIPDIIAVEMEGAAVAQVCAEHGVPCVVSRTISDGADHAADVDFTLFVAQAAAICADRFVVEFINRL